MDGTDAGEALCPGLADAHHPRPIVYNHTLSADKSLVCAAATLAAWLQGSLRDLEACSCRRCWLLAALAGTEWWAHVQLSCSLETCCRGSQVVSFVVNHLPILRRFSEVTEAPIARAETSYVASSMTMAASVGVSSHIPRITALP